MGSMGIYQIQNLVTEQSYVGQSTNIKFRLRSHLSALRRNAHDNPHLQRAWNKYGSDAFVLKHVITCEKEDLTRFEQAAYNHLNCIYGCYNVGPFMDSSSRGKLMSDETKQRMSKSHIGKKRRPFFAAHKKNMSMAAKLRTSRGPHSIETRQRIRKSLIGKQHSEERRRRNSESQKRRFVVRLGYPSKEVSV